MKRRLPQGSHSYLRGECSRHAADASGARRASPQRSGAVPSVSAVTNDE